MSSAADAVEFVDPGIFSAIPRTLSPVVMSGLFPPAFCQDVVKRVERLPHSAGGTVDLPEGYRRCESGWLEPRADYADVYRSVARAFESANGEFGFRLDGMVEPVMFARYTIDDGFDWHLDTGSSISAYRKISLTVQLSGEADYDGGELEFAGFPDFTTPRSTGTAIAFPAFLAHRVKPVTRGTRLSLVAWAYGPEVT